MIIVKFLHAPPKHRISDPTALHAFPIIKSGAADPTPQPWRPLPTTTHLPNTPTQHINRHPITNRITLCIYILQNSAVTPTLAYFLTTAVCSTTAEKANGLCGLWKPQPASPCHPNSTAIVCGPPRSVECLNLRAALIWLGRIAFSGHDATKLNEMRVRAA